MASSIAARSAAIEDIDPVEAALRVDLAAAYRLVHLFGWEDLIATHISVRLPGDNAFLINPFGLMFDEITPADLVKVDIDGNIIAPTKWKVNRPGFVINSAIHRARHDVICAMHLHTPDGIAVSMLEEGLIPNNQTSLVVAGDIAFHEFEGFANNLEERERLVADLGKKNMMFLRNHGTLALGTSVAQAFVNMYYLETSCTIQVRAYGMGQKVHSISPSVVKSTIEGRGSMGSDYSDKLVWPALLRRLDKVSPDWRG
jgi:ribulose-5-phosphate 4-epimerase/fuculose-1-phosphate aldolase